MSRFPTFKQFFHSVHHQEPFLWQSRLAEEVQCAGWPDLIDIPTGCGKTAVLDIASYVLAFQLHGGARTTASLRTALVVDRRLVVDDAFARALKIAEFIANDEKAIMIKDSLARAAGNTEPALVAARLRGGVPMQNDWLRTPCQPALLVSTVDQVGSRILFGGYGVSDRMAAIHAGLLGTDTQIFLDEAHLAEPFRQTVHALSTLQADERPRPAITLLSATSGIDVHETFTLSRRERQEPLIEQRISRPKMVRLRKVNKRQDDPSFAKAIAKEALELAGEGIVGVIVNRVATARHVHEQIAEQVDGKVVLMTGRSRPIARQLIEKQLDAIHTGSKDRAAAPAFVVATQCIEAGADLDFDAMVTQAAPFDSLRQRVGRLNRAGRLEQARATLIAASDDLAKTGEFLYGTKTLAAWEMLEDLADDNQVDICQASLEEVFGELSLERIAAVSADRPDAPVLMPAYLDLWSRTSPRPHASPDIPLFLHGPDAPRPEVNLIWRADLDPDRQNDKETLELLQQSRPRTSEVLAMPIYVVRQWLLLCVSNPRKKNPIDLKPVGDIASRSDESHSDRESDLKRPVFRFSQHTRDCGWISVGKIRPGDLLALPSTHGGYDPFGWNPDCSLPVRDFGHEAAWPYRDTGFALRVSKAMLLALVVGAFPATREGRSLLEKAEKRMANLWHRTWEKLTIQDLDEISPELLYDRIVTAATETTRTVRTVFDENTTHVSQSDALEALEALGTRACRITDMSVPTDHRVLILHLADFSGQWSTKKSVWRNGRNGGLSVTDNDKLGLASSKPVMLEEHTNDVVRIATAFATQSGMSDHLQSDIAIAARLHDLGKADLRFQQVLANSPDGAMRALQGMTLAKSPAGQSTRPPGLKAELPRGWRHESLSVRIAAASPVLEAANDPLLVLWLIGTHHGLGRPMFGHEDPADSIPRRLGKSTDVPEILAEGPGPQRPDFEMLDRQSGSEPEIVDWVQAFERLNRRYGYYGLANIEATLRLADHRASEIHHAF